MLYKSGNQLARNAAEKTSVKVSDAVKETISWWVRVKNTFGESAGI